MNWWHYMGLTSKLSKKTPLIPFTESPTVPSEKVESHAFSYAVFPPSSGVISTVKL